jgi:hypothetical protein
MGYLRTMGAGLAGSTTKLYGNANVNQIQYGDKLQGLPPVTGRRDPYRVYKSKAGGNAPDRFRVFCVNQLGGIGMGNKNSQFAPNADGLGWCPNRNNSREGDVGINKADRGHKSNRSQSRADEKAEFDIIDSMIVKGTGIKQHGYTLSDHDGVRVGNDIAVASVGHVYQANGTIYSPPLRQWRELREELTKLMSKGNGGNTENFMLCVAGEKETVVEGEGDKNFEARFIHLVPTTNEIMLPLPVDGATATVTLTQAIKKLIVSLEEEWPDVLRVFDKSIGNFYVPEFHTYTVGHAQAAEREDHGKFVLAVLYGNTTADFSKAKKYMQHDGRGVIYNGEIMVYCDGWCCGEKHNPRPCKKDPCTASNHFC